MRRSGKIILVAHCMLNPNAKVKGLAITPGALPIAGEIIKDGIGIIQLPCPEQSCFGSLRWGATKEQYDTLGYRKKCRALLSDIAEQIAEYLRCGYSVIGALGMNGSPTCGVEYTCAGFEGGELSMMVGLPQCSLCEGQGVLFEELSSMLAETGISIPMAGIDESSPEQADWNALKAKLAAR